MIQIRPVTELADFETLEQLQLETWGTPRRVLPARYLAAFQRSGAALLGAYEGDRPVGFSIATLGTVDDPTRVDQVAAARLKLYSATMVIHPDFQGQGLGYRLKLAQRDFAAVIGVRLITWVFDPLIGRNAWLAIGKLGAVCSQYQADYFTAVDGLAEDRLVAEWWVTGNRARSRIAGRRGALSLRAFLDGGAILVNEAPPNDEGWPVPELRLDAAGASIILLEIPADFRTLRQVAPALAQTWRRHVREVLAHAVTQGYLITDFVRHVEADGRPRNFYVLTHRNA